MRRAQFLDLPTRDMGRVLGLGAGMAIVAFGPWLVRRRGSTFPVRLSLAGRFSLLVRPVIGWLTLRVQDIGDDDDGKG